MEVDSRAERAAWRGFSHDALLDAVSRDLAEAGWVNDPAASDEGSSYPIQAAGNALLASLFKKWRSESTAAEDRALLIFLEANHLSREWTLPDEFLFSGRLNTVFERIKRELDNFLHPNGELLISSFKDIWMEGYAGPGASIGARGYSFYAKHGASVLTTGSPDLYYSYRNWLLTRPLWDAAEKQRISLAGEAELVDCSNVSFAPKNANVARLICTEPSLNMFAQLGIKTILDRRMLQLWGVDMEDQPEINRFLARVGSQNGEFATLDLASASDSVSVNACRELMPRWFFDLLMAARSPACMIRSHGLRVELGMMSTMGNGFTFPVMTILLSCVVRAVYHQLSIPIRDNRRLSDASGPFKASRLYTVPANWAVFGDDIIVCREAYDMVVEVLGLLGFTVNSTKSFNTGPFRESCGHDYYRGLNIRGVYLKRLTSPQDLAVAVNLLVNWTAQTGICLGHACRYLMGLFRDSHVHYVPYADPLDSGIRVPSELIPTHIRRTRKGPRWRFKTCYKSWSRSSKRIVVGDGTLDVPRGSRRLGYNADALLLSFLLGEVRDGCISVRQNRTRVYYHTQWHVTPDWDYVPPSFWFNHRDDWRRFQSAVYVNLFA